MKLTFTIIVLLIIVPCSAYAGCYDYTEPETTITAPVYRICNPGGHCESTTLDTECTNAYSAMKSFSNGMSIDIDNENGNIASISFHGDLVWTGNLEDDWGGWVIKKIKTESFKPFTSFVMEKEGDLYLKIQDNEIRLTHTGLNKSPIIHPGGEWIYYIKTTEAKNNGDMGSVDPPIGYIGNYVFKEEIWRMKISGEGKSFVYKSSRSPEPNQTWYTLSSIDNIQFSPSGDKIYFQSDPYTVTGTIWVMESDGSNAQLMSSGHSIRIIESNTDGTDNRYKGYLIIQQHRYFTFGGSYDWYWLFDPDFKKIGPIGDNIPDDLSFYNQTVWKPSPINEPMMYDDTKPQTVVRKADKSQNNIVTDSDNISNAKLFPRQIEIIQTVLNPNGYISKELHSEFWGLMPVELKNDKQAVDAMMYFIEKNFVLGTHFTQEGFASMKASIEAGQVVKTPGYDLARDKFYTSVPPQARPEIQKSIDNAEGMITAAAEAKPFQSDRGTIYITLEMVNQVIAGLNDSFSRASRLMNPEW